MKIYTSYFDNIQQLKDNNILKIAICRYPPEGYINLSGVAPTTEILSNYRGQNNAYTAKYLEMLHGIDLNSFLEYLKDLSEQNGNKDIALCCYEKPNEFCHRHLLAEYLNNNYGTDIHEFSAKDEYENIKSMELF